MNIKFFCPIWGMVPDYIDEVQGSIETIFTKIKDAGYDGVEMAVPFSDKQKTELVTLLKQFDLGLIALQWAATGKDPADYLRSYEQHMRSAAEVKPLFINSHTATDYFTFHDVCSVLDCASALSKSLGVTILHETHRGRFSFHSAGIQQYLRAYPELRLTGDFSHWCNVSESYLTDQRENLQNALDRTDHIHARVGHPQSPQVSDPRAPEWKDALNRHLEWWDVVVGNHRTKSSDTLTVTPEFGPGNYMPLLPYTQQPVSSQWEINLWMRDLLRTRYAHSPQG